MNSVKVRDNLSWIFAFFPILNIYETGIIPALSIGQILLVGSMMKFITRGHSFKLKFSNFFLYGVLITIINFARPSVIFIQSAYELVAFVLFFLLLSYVMDRGNYQAVRKQLYVLGYICLSFFYIQYLLFSLGIHVVGVIPGIPLSNGSDSEAFHQSHLLVTRLSSLFQEPAHYAEFMCLFLSFILFKESSTRRNNLIAVLISISVILCQSAGGYMLLLTCWGVKLFSNMGSRKGRMAIMILVPLLIIALPILSQFEIISKVLDRYLSLSLQPENSEYGYSSYTRLFRGYIPIMESPFLLQIFGNGFGTLLSFVKANPNSNYLMYTDYDPNWINSFQLVIFSFGIIGGILFFKKLIYVAKRTSYFGRSLFFIYMLAMLSSGILLTASSMLFLFFMYKEYLLYNGLNKK